MKQLSFPASLAFVIVFFSSCHFFHHKKINGNGQVVMEPRDVKDFNSIDVSGGIHVYITQDPVYSVKVEIDDNLQEYIDVYKEGSTLKVKQEDNTDLNITKEHINVYISAPEYRKLDASGACNFYTKDEIQANHTLDIDLSGACQADLKVNAPKIEAGLSGAGVIELDGETNELDIHGSGSSDIRCYDMIAQHVKVHLSGAGKAEVYAGVSLKADISGAGEVLYKGNAPEVSKSVSGAGRIEKTD